MNFFHGLDSNRYGSFKANMMNGWASKAISIPENVIIIYRLAGSWVKTNAMKTEGKTSLTFMTTTDNPRYLAINWKESSNKQAENKEKSKGEKDLSHITYFVCGKRGYYATKFPNKYKS
jgi:hypothetical protein